MKENDDFSHLNAGEGSAEPQTEAPPRKRKGFAGMSAEKRSKISSMGGKAAHAMGRAHKFTSEKAREAGKKGGSAPHVRRGPVPRTELVK